MKGKKSTEKCKVSEGKWREAIADAQDRLILNKQRAARIKAAIRVFENNITMNVPFPDKKGPRSEPRPESD